jgi:acyl-CoA:acyl-CoA alkyltransferase
VFQSTAGNGCGLLSQMQLYREPVSRVLAIGKALPDRIVTNQHIADSVDAPPKIKRRLPSLIYRATLIKTRRYAEPGTSPSDLAVQAARDALICARLDVHDIDTLIYCGTDMDMLEPATANIVQKKLGISRINSFDVTNACNGFLQAMNIANSLIGTGAAHRVLITTGEIGSYCCNRSIQNMEDFIIKVGGLTLGDAGAAIVMTQAEGRGGLLEINLLNVAEHWELCHVPEVRNWRQLEDGLIHGWFYLDMQGLAKVARRLTIEYFEGYQGYRLREHSEDRIQDSLAKVVPHQISRRFIEEMVRATRGEMDMVCVTADIYGNTASSAIPLALRQLLDDGDLQFGSGQEVLLYGAASGFGLGHIRLRL